MSITFADNQTYESRTERTGHKHLQRQVRREAACAPRKGRIDSRRGCGNTWSQFEHRLPLGIWKECPKSCRPTRSCRSLESHKNKKHTPERINLFYNFYDTPVDGCRNFCRIPHAKLNMRSRTPVLESIREQEVCVP